MEDYKRFEKLSFEDFRRLATDDSLSPYSKIGFPDSYRRGKEPLIVEDICRKLSVLQAGHKVVLDIGPGCSELPVILMDRWLAKGHQLLLVDSAEMLAHLPDKPGVTKFAACYPECESLFEAYGGRISAILAYSVLHYVFNEASLWRFLDKSLSLLAPGGQLLLGDIPNVSKRKRFFGSATGIAFHKTFMQTDQNPEVRYNCIEHDQIDDSVLLGLVSRARNQGFDAYIVPQPPALPMANRREDILIERP
jgi:hypothetical protein